MMLLSVDFANKRVDLISIPRDTMANIYNVTGRWKINAAFAKGGSATGDGFHYAIETVQDLLGVPISIMPAWIWWDLRRRWTPWAA